MRKGIRGIFKKLFGLFFKKKKELKIGLYGPPNGGKTTLANRISMDWLGEEMGNVSPIAHETREIKMKEIILKKWRMPLFWFVREGNIISIL